LTAPAAGSYRDRHSGVAFDGDRVRRHFDEEGAEWFRAAVDSGLIDELASAGLVIDHAVVAEDPYVVESPLIPAVTFPYEWTASMLRDAGLLTLEIARRAWDAGFHIQDASAFNVVFRNGKPTMVDLGSFRPGHTPYFLAYGQFCDHFLNPLVLASTTGVSVRAGWHSLEGLPAPTVRSLVRSRLIRPGLLRHVWARAALERKAETMKSGDRKTLRTEFGLPPGAIRKSFDQLSEILQRLDLTGSGVWDQYEHTHSYAGDEAQAKADFVRRVAEQRAGLTAVDVGANTGNFSEILASSFDSVVAVEPDEATVELMYGRIKEGALASNIVPMVMDIVDPSPGRGFNNAERPSALDRLRGVDLMVWLAVFHHLVISRNVPLPMLFALAADLAEFHVVEHVAPEDEMAKLLLSSREETPWPFDQEAFEAAASERFDVVQSQKVSATRTLYELRRR
jgi:hypothetical protein